MGRQDFETETLIPVTGGFFDGPAHTLRADGFDASEDGTGRGTPIIPTHCIQGVNKPRAKGGHGMGINGGDVSYTLGAEEQHAIAFAQNTRDEVRQIGGDGQIVGALAAEAGMKQTNYIAFDTTQVTSKGNYSVPKAGEPCHPLASGAHAPAVAFQESQSGLREYGDAGCVRANGPGHDPVGTRIRDGMAVRRLTPRECERLQGFPDDYTLVAHRGKPAADGPRYRALGNSMAVPVLKWIGERIEMVEQLEQEVA